jgi:hypothetical protein
MLAQINEPVKKQKELMESLGFHLVMTDENKQYGESAWVKDFKIKDQGESYFTVGIYLKRKEVPDFKSLIDQIVQCSFSSGSDSIKDKIKETLGIHGGNKEVYDL